MIGCYQYAINMFCISLYKFPGDAVEDLNYCLATLANCLKVNKLKLKRQ